MKQLRIANQLYDAGNWAQAAGQFELLADAALRRGLPQAAQLFLRAGQARIQNGEHAAGIGHLKKAVRLFARFGQAERLGRIRAHIVDALNQFGLEREAALLNQMIHDVLDDNLADAPVPTPSPSHFPPKCSACGGSLRPDEMELLDHRTGVCGYCGSVNYAS